MNRHRLLVIVGVWLVLVVSLGVADAEPEVFALAGIVAIGAALVIAARDLVIVTRPMVWGRRPPQVGARASDRYAVTLRRQMSSGRRLDSPELRDVLVSLVDDRLRAHHGVDRATDPAAASARLDPILQRLLTDPRPPTMRDLRRIVPALEAL